MTKESLGMVYCRLWMCAMIAMILLGARGAFAQSAARPDPASSASTASSANSGKSQFKLRTRVEVVNVPISVIDRRGYPVFNLTKNDFTILDDGIPQTISYFNKVPAPPLRIGILMDTSNSALESLKFEKEAAREFAYDMLRDPTANNLIFLETFDTSSSLVQDFTSDPNALNNKIRGLKAGGAQALYDAIFWACKHELTGAGPADYTRRVLVLISNGLDVNSRHTLDEVIAMAREAQTAIYSVDNVPYGFSDLGESTLKRLAHDTGGEAFFPLHHSPGTGFLNGYLAHGQFDNTQQNHGLDAQSGIYGAQRMLRLADALRDLGRQLNDQYDLGYSPSEHSLDGAYHTIRVEVEAVNRKTFRVYSKPGYFAVRRPDSLNVGAASKKHKSRTSH